MSAVFEGSSVEFKREFTDEIKKTVAAFANCDGGVLYIGIEDDGAVCGISDADKTLQRVANTIRDAIRPDLTRFTECGCEILDNKTVIKISVRRGTLRPYFIAGKGISPQGVFVRHGASTVAADELSIFAMLRESAGDSFEDAVSAKQELTFEQTAGYFQKFGVKFDENSRKSLRFINSGGVFTNLAYLLSDQCEVSLKLALFDGTDKTIFRDRSDETGSLLEQLDRGYAFLDRYNRLHAEISGLYRVDRRDYPEEAVRETLLNTIVHREYAVNAPALVSIFDDRMEFVSVGGLAKGVSREDIMIGVSSARNPKLANVFYRLKLIEAYGTGIMKIINCYKGSGKMPEFIITANAFKTVLPNLNYTDKKTDSSLCRVQEIRSGQKLFGRAAEPVVLPCDAVRLERENAVLSLCSQNGFTTRREVQATLSVSQATAILLLRGMLERGHLEKIGAGKNSVYRAKKLL